MTQFPRRAWERAQWLRQTLVRETPDLFGLTASTYRPPITGEPQESLRDGIAMRQRLEMCEGQTVVVVTAEERHLRSPNGPSMVGEPLGEHETVLGPDRGLTDCTQC